MSTKKFGIVAGLVFALSIVLSPAASACSLNDLSSCDNTGLMALILQLLSGQTTTTTTTTTTTGISGIPAGFQFNTNLKLGSTGDDVKYLQILLNTDYATAVGNAGSETSYFGTMTQAAVIKFQNKYASEVLTPYGLTAGTGFFGTSSRAKANALLGSLPTTPTTPTTPTLPVGCTSTSGFSPITGQSCATGVAPVTGGFTVSLAPTSPVAGTLVQKQATADLAHYTFSNGTANPITVTSVTLDRIGVSADSTLANVYLFDGAVRLTDAASITAGKANFNISGGIFTIPASTIKTIAVKSDIADSTSGQTVGVSLSAIASNGTLSSTLPVAGSINTIASATLASVDLTQQSNSSTSDPIDDVKIWESQFNVGTRSVQFTKLALNQISSIESKDISNFKLYVDGVLVSTVANLDVNKYITFVFDKTLTTGNRYVKVMADITGGSSRIAQFSLRNKADLELRDSEYNVNISAGGTFPANSTAMTVNQGNIVVTKSTTSVSGNVSNNGSNVSLAKFEFKASGESLKVQSITAGFEHKNSGGTAQTSTLRNGKILVNGGQVGSTTTIAPAGTLFNTNFIIQPGETAIVEIVADIYDNDGTGAIAATDTIKAKITATSIQRQSSLTAVGSQTSEGNTVTVAEGALDILKTTSYVDQTTVAPRQGFKLASWDLIGSTSEAINVNTMIVAFSGTANTVADHIKNVYLVYGTTTSPMKSTIAATANEWSTSFTLAKNEIIKVELYGDIQTGAETGRIASLAVKGIGASSSSTADHAAENGQTINIAAGSITATVAPTAPISSLVYGGGNSVVTSSLRFTTANDSYTISELVVTLPASGTTAITAVNLKDGANVVATRSPSTTVTFSGLSIPVDGNSYKVLDVEVVTTNIGTYAGTTGADLTTTYSSAKAIPSSTGTEAPVTNATATGNGIYVYKGVPTITTLTLPTVILAPTTQAMIKYSIAPNGGVVTWRKMVFDVSTSAVVEVGSIKLYDVDTGLEVPGLAVATGTNFPGAGASTDGKITFYATSTQTVSSTKTYELRATMGGAIDTGHYVQTSIARPSVTYAASTKAYAFGTAAGTTTLAYSDVATVGTVSTSDVRQTAVDKYTSAKSTTATFGTGEGDGFVSKAYGITTGRTIVVASDGSSNAVAVAGTLVSADSAICKMYQSDGTTEVAVGEAISGVRFVECTTATGNIRIQATDSANAGGENYDAAASKNITYTITKEAAGYATNTAVAATDSDVDIALTAGVPATASFIWSDASAQGHNIGTTDWTTDFLVRNLPTGVSALSK